MTRRLLCAALLLALLVMATSLTAQETPQTTNVTIHVVQRGENLFRIALEYGTTVEVLTQLNGITLADSIAVGQRLLVPTATTGTAQAHVVQPGETLASIAALYGITPEALAAENSITDQTGFYVGLGLIIAAAEPSSRCR